MAGRTGLKLPEGPSARRHYDLLEEDQYISTSLQVIAGAMRIPQGRRPRRLCSLSPPLCSLEGSERGRVLLVGARRGR